jgi:hypothetical protein
MSYLDADTVRAWVDRPVVVIVRVPEGLALHGQPVDGESIRLGAWPGMLPQPHFQISPDGALGVRR